MQKCFFVTEKRLNSQPRLQAEVAELVDAHDSNSCSARSAGSTPAFGTETLIRKCQGFLLAELKIKFVLNERSMRLLVITILCFSSGVLKGQMAEGFLLDGHVNRVNGNPVQAIVDYSKAIAVDSANAAAYFYRAEVKADLFDYLGSLADYTKTIEVDSNHFDAFIGMALSKFELKDTTGAIRSLNDLITRAPFYWLAFSNRGWLHYVAGDFEKALSDLDKAIKITTRMEPIDYLNRGLVRLELGDFKGAQSDFGFSINNGGPPYAYYQRGKAKLAREKTGSACRDFLRASSQGVAEAAEAFEKYCGE